MAVTLDLLRDALGQTFQQVFSPSQIGQNNRSGFPIDPSGLYDAPVEMSPGFSFLKGGHIGVYNTQYGGACQELFIIILDKYPNNIELTKNYKNILISVYTI